MTVRRALNITREENFAEWFQAVVRDADMAENSPVRGCMIIKPWGYGVWELMQAELDRRIKATGHDNCYFPLFVPLSFFAKEAEHVEGFAKEMAVVTHHRLKMVDGQLVPDPEAKLEEPLVVRPTSETIIGDAFSRWVKSYRDLPVLINQWANVVRWEMRTRMFLRTTEFLWQEGHTAHANEAEAREETLKMLEVYRGFVEEVLALPVVTGEKPENERFPGAVSTYSIEAMMQDGKALQAGTSHYLGTNFAHAQNIRYQSEAGDLEYCHTTSWGTSTRMVGGVIMTHGDDDGLRLPPLIAPQQIVIVPMLRGGDQDAALLGYCDAIAGELRDQRLNGVPLRVLVDRKPIKAAEKRWNWVRRGAPIVVEVGGRDMDNGVVTYLLRHALRDGEKVAMHNQPRGEFVAAAAGQLEAIQTALYDEAKARLDGNIRTGFDDFAAVAAHYSGDEDSFKGWIRTGWSRPTGAGLDKVEQMLKAHKLTIRNAPLDQGERSPTCVFTGEAAIEDILIGRSY